MTEAAPRKVCVRCGKALPPPNGSATYVYGVGAVGYQSCAACGAKWRYLWHDQPALRIKSDGRGRGRLFAVLGGLFLATVVVVGLFGGDVTISTPYIPIKAMTLRGSYVGSPKELKELLALVRKTRMPPIPIDRRPLQEANAGLMDLKAGKVVGRVVLTPAS